MNGHVGMSAYADLQLNGAPRCNAFAGSIYETGTCTVILPLVAGDKVYVVTPAFTGKLFVLLSLFAEKCYLYLIEVTENSSFSRIVNFISKRKI